MASSIILRLARELGLSAEEVERKASESLLREELRRVRAEKASILSKYRVKSFSELMRLVEEGVVSDVDAHEDIVRIDYLEHREKTLERLLREIGQRGSQG